MCESGRGRLDRLQRNLSGPESSKGHNKNSNALRTTNALHGSGARQNSLGSIILLWPLAIAPIVDWAAARSQVWPVRRAGDSPQAPFHKPVDRNPCAVASSQYPGHCCLRCSNTPLGTGSGEVVKPQHVAVLACMDARLEVHKILGLEKRRCANIPNAGKQRRGVDLMPSHSDVNTGLSRARLLNGDGGGQLEHGPSRRLELRAFLCSSSCSNRRR